MITQRMQDELQLSAQVAVSELVEEFYTEFLGERVNYGESIRRDEQPIDEPEAISGEIAQPDQEGQIPI